MLISVTIVIHFIAFGLIMSKYMTFLVDALLFTMIKKVTVWTDFWSRIIEDRAILPHSDPADHLI